jgi:hypothetical protein
MFPNFLSGHLQIIEACKKMENYGSCLIPLTLPSPSRGEGEHNKIRRETPSPLRGEGVQKIGFRPFPVIPAEAGIQYFQTVKDFLDPGFHRGDD